MTPHRWSFGPRVLQASGALLIAGLMAGCDATSAQSGQITAPAQNVRPAPPAASPAEQSAPQPGTATSTATSTGSTGSRATPTTAEVRHQPSKVERCHTSMLTGSLQNSEAGAGQRYAQLVLQNTSEQTCTLYGYGGMQLVNESGKPLPTTMERTPNPGPNLITLAPGQSASATLHWTAVPHEGEPTDGPCQPTPVSAQVIPPDETDALAVTWNLGPVCGFGAINNSAYHQ